MKHFIDYLSDFKLLLATQSPRRHLLLKELGLPFVLMDKREVPEVIEKGMSQTEAVKHLASMKAEPYRKDLVKNDILITADTIVCLEDQILGKPKDRDDALRMIESLSDAAHWVLTAVCLTGLNESTCFVAKTKVYFAELDASERVYYVDHYKPFDKAGAYGIQEWIGLIGIAAIEGSYFNVMGLPVQRLYEELKRFTKFQTK